MDHSMHDDLPADGSGYEEGAVNASPPSPERRRRPAAVLVGILAALMLTLVVVDRVATGRVENRIATAFQDGLDTPEQPSVHIDGFPVLTQLTDGTLRHVAITAHDLPARGGERPVPVAELAVGLDHLELSDNAEVAHARAVDATAFLSYEDLSNTLGPGISRDTDPGRVEAVLTRPLLGEVTVSAAVRAVSGNRVRFTDVRVTHGNLPPSARRLLDRFFSEPVPLRNIPEGLHLRSVTPTATGLDAHFTGETVTYRPQSSAA
ncbi:DUF2993 domain-containing protein [Streptomyces althioticus]|uniref:DUF2993 domain-containing protein n=1 Tax=Streptomyces althioticus TaxID=83380 RepID=A0ABZ1Y2L3_9ACTN|nr:DUF2993 domain-containing protein [Streptomyces sp. H28]